MILEFEPLSLCFSAQVDKALFLGMFCFCSWTLFDLGTGPRLSCMLSRYCTTDLHSQPGFGNVSAFLKDSSFSPISFCLPPLSFFPSFSLSLFLQTFFLYSLSIKNQNHTKIPFWYHLGLPISK